MTLVTILSPEPHLFPENLLTEQPPGDGRKWWAVYTRARQEKALGRDLFGYEVPFYLPLIPKENLIRGRRVRSQIPLFSGYLFLYGTEEQRVLTLTTNRISRILPVHDELQLVRDLTHLNTLIERGVPLTVEGRLEPGQRVRIKNGSLLGLEGTILRRRNRQRLLVAVNYLQQGVSVEIDDFMVEPI